MGHIFDAVTIETLTGHRTLTAAEVEDNVIMSFDPGGAARNLILPAEASCTGRFLFVHNRADAAEVITVLDDASGYTVCTPTQNEGALLFCDGLRWMGGTVTGS